jgi:hypothetical protein
MATIPYTREAFFAAVERAKREVVADVRAGVVPAGVRDFADLHDYVDANGYGGAFEAWEDGDTQDDRWCRFWDGVQEQVHRWLRGGGRRGA